MAEPIKVGDLVTVVRTCCSTTADESIGLIGTVTTIEAFRTGTWACTYCSADGNDLKAKFSNSSFPIAPLSWLKRIPPLSELEGERTEEKLHV